MSLRNNTLRFSYSTFRVSNLRCVVYKLIVFLSCIFNLPAYGQNINQNYHINTIGSIPSITKGHLKLGSHISPNGDTLDINSYYFIKNGHPWYPIMGEMHYSRVPREQWEESILKMKAAGIQIIASYVIWIYHEEKQGVFDFSGQQDLKYFIELCKKHHMYVHLRLGPWVHGEVRNGGFPDWMQQRGRKVLRNNSGEYLDDVEKFWYQVSQQTRGLFFKDGGPVIGIQIENEFRFNNPNGLKHMLTLKNMAIKLGFDVPYYTATGWPGSDLSQNELIPVWGQYPAAPWTTNSKKLKRIDGYLFGPLKNDPNIGIDLLGSNDQASVTNQYQYPYATAEMGGGNQVTYHRRPIITSNDLLGIHYSVIGSGANLMGYYMFHGGSNQIGKYSTLQESKATGYPNDCPIISYDFQSPIGEYGQLKPAFNEFKILHSFLNHYGNLLCTYTPSFPDQRPLGAGDNSVLRMAVRSNGSSGFIFVNNYQRHLQMKSLKGVKLTLDLANNQHISFPKSGLNVEANTQMILPFNMDLDGITLKYATLQPLCLLNNQTKTYVFFMPDGVTAEISLNKRNIKNMVAPKIQMEENGDSYLLQDLKTGDDGLIEIHKSDDKMVKILILSKQDALNSWQTNIKNKDRIVVSENQLFLQDSSIVFTSTNNSFEASIYPKIQGLKFQGAKTNEKEESIFSHYQTAVKSCNVPQVKMKPLSFDKIQKEKTSVPKDDKRMGTPPENPGPQYQTFLSDIEGAKYWQISIPKIKHPFISNAYMVLDYLGDTGSLYKNGKLVADDFCQGNTTQIGLKKFDFQLSSTQFIFQLVPLKKERDIYFEDDVKDKILNSQQQINQINIQWQYQITMF